MAADVIVLGGGFAGLAALDRLVRARRRVELSLSLIDRSEHSTFAPLLPDVLSGRVHTTRLRYDLARHCRRLGVRFVRAGVAAIDPQAPRVETDAGALTADYLVVCLGCDTRYPQDAALRRRAVGLKSVEDALALRERARGLVDALITDGGRGATGAVVVGGGYTGFELASHLVQTVEMSTHRSYKRWRDVCPVVVVEAAPAPLAGCSPAVRRWVVSAARRSGVRLRTGVTVSRAAGDGMLELSDGSHLRGALLAWCAGTITGPACEGLLPAGTAGRRVPVDVYLRAIGCQRVFCAGDASGASSHKFSSGSHAEGRIAGKAAIRYLVNEKPDLPSIADDKIAALKEEVYKPLAVFEENKGKTTQTDVNPNYILPNMFMMRLQKIMDEYAGGVTAQFTTSKPMLDRGLELLAFLKEDSEKLGAEDLHELMRCWENYHRMFQAEAHVRTILYREETRWPGYYFRADFPKLNQDDWHCFVNCTYNAAEGSWDMLKRPIKPVFGD